MPSDIVNLNKARKAKARGEKQKRAEENRAKFGRTQIQRTRDEDERARRDALLDGAKLDFSRDGVLGRVQRGGGGGRRTARKPRGFD
jgi:hypothetical protein